MALNVSGEWQIEQTNGFIVDVRVGQIRPNGEFTVNAKYILQGTTQTGSGFGSVTDIQFQCTIDWLNGSRGVYIGELNPQTGRLNGSTFDASSPNTFAGWQSLRSF
ncbi:hypothetical protein [Chroococcus sp. FPU101]|uniref:hypothetical protein n=1 Tax=Chroococcus sp. FPU101 TaxID=1974212 RepID=UPI001A8C10A6|nr:hypothetical protein [Chroococcus sp. FPU101]GFE72240.1 hypothetical protein CFPU101_48500 [Chroococcus sp. FPU101]